MESIRVFVVDDHPMIRHGLAAMLRAEAGITWVGEAADAAEAIRAAPALAPDVVLMDLVMPRMDGVETISALRPMMPNTHFVVLTSLLDPNEARRAMAAEVNMGRMLTSKAASPAWLATAEMSSGRSSASRSAPKPPLLRPAAARASRAGTVGKCWSTNGMTSSARYVW